MMRIVHPTEKMIRNMATPRCKSGSKKGDVARVTIAKITKIIDAIHTRLKGN